MRRSTVERWAALLAAVLAAEGVAAGAEAGLTFVSPSAMAVLNQAHMGGTGPDRRAGVPDRRAPPTAPVGRRRRAWSATWSICPVVAWAGSAGHAGSDEDELALLVVHGALHLLGHDHAEDDERATMQGRERALLAAHHGVLAGDPWEGAAS